MIFDPYFIVHYLSQFMVLEPGDLINTGTPPGVGHGLRARRSGCSRATSWSSASTASGTQRQRVIAPR